uniref:hypothetical protein n=1 Tax=Vibrio alfacsensis TaxID=1074311 RepID=UPI0013E36EAF|nr:hypothetical protein [Vibrio alfacsensis]
MEANQIRKGMVVECQQGVGTIIVVDREAETVLLSKQGSEEQLAVSFDEIEDNPQLHGNSDRYY